MQQFKNPTTSPSNLDNPDAFLNDNFLAQFHKADTSPHTALQKPWREPLQTPAYAQEHKVRKEREWPSPYALLGYAVTIGLVLYGGSIGCISMAQAFLRAIQAIH